MSNDTLLPDLSTTASNGAGARPARELKLWAAIGVLSIALLATAGLLIWDRPGSAAPPSANPTTSTGPAGMSTAGLAPRQPFVEDGPSTGAQPSVVTAPSDVVTAPRAAPAAQPAAAPQGARAPTAVPAAAMGAPVARAPAPVCGTCGVVESVTPVHHAAPPTGVGAVAGGVLGGVLGNQIGGGSGRALATVAGVVGGGYVGHQVEKSARTTTSYRIGVRMDDGRLRNVTRGAPVAVGSRVTVSGGGTLRLAGNGTAGGG